MKLRMNTISRRVEYLGTGLHSGKKVKLSVSPSPGSGISFVRTDIKDFTHITLSTSTCSYGQRCSEVKSDQGSINTVEHLLAAMYMLNLTDVLVEASGEEIPAGDGSAATFLELLDNASVVSVCDEVDFFTPKNRIEIEQDGWSISMLPSDEFSIAYTLDQAHLGLGRQTVKTPVNEQTFREKISKARTFVPYQEAMKIRELGLGKGANSENTLLLGDVDAKERFKNEAVYHKILDIIGDLACIRRPIRASIVAEATGHRQNAMLAEAIAREIRGD